MISRSVTASANKYSCTALPLYIPLAGVNAPPCLHEMAAQRGRTAAANPNQASLVSPEGAFNRVWLSCVGLVHQKPPGSRARSPPKPGTTDRCGGVDHAHFTPQLGALLDLTVAVTLHLGVLAFAAARDGSCHDGITTAQLILLHIGPSSRSLCFCACLFLLV